jgi:alpha-tubulin suppressor-like RCC1 family protein
MSHAMRPQTSLAALALLVAQHAFAGGTVLGWGATLDGQLPVPAALGACNTLSAGSGHSAAVKQTGLVACWGLNTSGQCNVPATLGACKMVSAGARHTAAIKTTGAVVVWGDNTSGQRNVPATLGACSQVSCGDSHTVALRTTGYVAAWGDNFYGQSSVPPTSVLGVCTAIEAGSFHTLVIQANGAVAAWGDASDNQGLVPNGLGACISIGAGDLHSAAVRSTGQVVCWGNNGQGQTTVPATLKPCIAVACGDFHTIALQQDGSVAAWGYSNSGQATVPPNLAKCTQVAGGGSHTLALSSNIAVPTGVTATDGTSTANVTVSWTAAAGATGYRVFRAVGAGLGVQIGTTTTPVTFVDTTATAGVSYTYWVKTTTANGDSVASAVNTGWRNVATPTGIAATDGTLTTGVTVSWSAVSGAAGYRVYRQIGTGTATQVGIPTTTSFTDTTAVAGTVYTYKVCARTAAGNSPFSTTDTGWRNLPPPTTVSATDGTFTTKVRVTWTAVTGATGYYVIRKLPTGTNTVIATIASGSTLLFDDTTIAPGVVAQYWVKSRSAAGASTYSVVNTGFRATAFTGDGGSSGGSPGEEDGAPTADAGVADGAADTDRTGAGGPWNEGASGSRTEGRTHEPSARETGERTGLPMACADLTARAAARIEWLLAQGKDNLAAQADALALEVLLEASTAQIDQEGCAVCRMARGDVNLDGAIDGADLGAFLGAFACGDAVTADLNRDGWVDLDDLALVITGAEQPR